MTEERSRRLTEIRQDAEGGRFMATTDVLWLLAALDASEAKAETLQRERDEQAQRIVFIDSTSRQLARAADGHKASEWLWRSQAETLAATLARVQGLPDEWRKEADDHDARLDFLVRHAGVNDDDRAIALRQAAEELASALTDRSHEDEGAAARSEPPAV